MRIPVFVYDPCDGFFQLVCHGDSVGFKGLAERFPDNGFMFLPVFPKVGTAGSGRLSGICHIKNIFDLRIISGTVQQCNAGRSPFHIAAHLLIPDIIGSTCHGVGTLGENHQLFFIGIFVDTGHSLQKRYPFLVTVGDLHGCFFGELREVF